MNEWWINEWWINGLMMNKLINWYMNDDWMD